MPAIRTLRDFHRAFHALEPERRNRNYHAPGGAGGLVVGVERRGEWCERLFVPSLGHRRAGQVEARRTGDDPVEAVREALRRDHPLPAAASPTSAEPASTASGAALTHAATAVARRPPMRTARAPTSA